MSTASSLRLYFLLHHFLKLIINLHQFLAIFFIGPSVHTSSRTCLLLPVIRDLLCLLCSFGPAASGSARGGPSRLKGAILSSSP